MCLENKGQKTKAWQGFLSYAPDMTIMSSVTKKLAETGICTPCSESAGCRTALTYSL